jgi:hypothetical protein
LSGSLPSKRAPTVGSAKESTPFTMRGSSGSAEAGSAVIAVTIARKR